jgi:gliding motility-associated-like protein
MKVFLRVLFLLFFLFVFDFTYSQQKQPPSIFSIDAIILGNNSIFATTTVSGRIYRDANNNGTQDPFENGIPNVDVLIFGVTISQAVSTDANGDWIAVIDPGPTTIAIDNTDLPPGYIQTEGTNPQTINAVANVDNFTDNDGFYFEGQINGHLYFDVNGNGSQDSGEPDMPNVTINITDTFGQVTSVSTDANGDWLATVAAVDVSIDIDDNDPDFPTGAIQTEGTDPTPFTVINNTNTFTENDGFFEQGILEGHLYLDVNGNGTQDTSEPDLANIDVNVVDALGTTHALITDANGNWSVILPAGNATSTIDVNDPDFPTGALQTEGTNPTTTMVVNNQTVSDDGVLNDGFFESGTLEGHAYLDKNGNGSQDPTEPDLANVDVNITTSLGTNLVVVTDAAGNWSVMVPIGNTTAFIDVNDPDFPTGAIQTEGTNPTTSLVTLNTVVSDDGTTVNDGFYEVGTLEGRVYFDANGNGTQDNQETGIANVRVNITDVFNTTQVVTTDGNGDWSVNLPAGTAVSDIENNDLPNGVVQTEGTDPTTSTIVTGQITSDDGPNTNDGFFAEGTLLGHLYHDQNNNGVQDAGEPNLPNVDVQITNSLGNTTVVTTNATGDWSITTPVGNTTSLIDVNDPDFLVGAVQTQGTNPTTTAVTANNVLNEVPDGFYLPAQNLGTLQGHLYFDSNGNGTQDVGEPDLSYVDVVITDSQGIIQVVTTNTSGDWSVNVPAGNTQSAIDRSDPDFPAGAIQTEGTDPTITAVTANNTISETPDGFSFTNQATGTLQGHVYHDVNGNGTQDSGEPNFSNVRIIVQDAANLTYNTVTDANGDWLVVVNAGAATSNVNNADLPPGFVQTQGTDPTTTNVVANTITAEIPDGFTDSNLPLGELTGHIYFDSNNNASQDTGEPNLPNVDVQIIDVNGIIQVISTDANGDWKVTVPEGLTTSDIVLTDPDMPPNVIQTEGSNPTITVVVQNTSTSEVPDGFFVPNTQFGMLQGHLYEDTNNNGILDAGEPDLPNIDVVITDALGIQQTLVTDTAGNWSVSVPEGITRSEIQITDPDFPAGAVQTQGTNPTLTVVVANTTTSEVPDGFYTTGNEVEVFRGIVYLDVNGNGTQDDNEPGIPNIPVQITDGQGNMIQVQTDSQGEWEEEIFTGQVLSYIDVDSPNFPSYSYQTEGSNPSSFTLLKDTPIFEKNGYHLEPLHVYNAISPNGDGKNDVLIIQGIERYPDNEFKVFNRWGVLVYEAKGYGQDNKFFTGFSQGRATPNKDEKLPSGTYFYTLKYRDSNNQERDLDGYLYIN